MAGSSAAVDSISSATSSSPSDKSQQPVNDLRQCVKSTNSSSSSVNSSVNSLSNGLQSSLSSGLSNSLQTNSSISSLSGGLSGGLSNSLSNSLLPGKKKESTPASQSGSSSIVFDFRGTNVKANVTVRNRSAGGFAVRTTSSEDDDDFNYTGITSAPEPSGIVFDGENVALEKSSLLTTRNKKVGTNPFVDHFLVNRFWRRSFSTFWQTFLDFHNWSHNCSVIGSDLESGKLWFRDFERLFCVEDLDFKRTWRCAVIVADRKLQ